MAQGFLVDIEYEDGRKQTAIAEVGGGTQTIEGLQAHYDDFKRRGANIFPGAVSIKVRPGSEYNVGDRRVGDRNQPPMPPAENVVAP